MIVYLYKYFILRYNNKENIEAGGGNCFGSGIIFLHPEEALIIWTMTELHVKNLTVKHGLQAGWFTFTA